MFKPTRPFNDRLTAYPKEPSLRIGRTVPQDAVNLAYYYNPTATDVEKILTAEAPRNTIDHRVEEAYRYLFDQATDDDDLFPGYVAYEDEEGYQGKLGRMYVQWYPEAHIEVKNVQETKQIVTTTKSGLPKMFEYSDAEGYSGNLYLDTEEYTVTKERDITSTEFRDREVFNHEVSFNEAFGRYIQPGQLDAWMIEPGILGSSQFPYIISISGNKATAIGGNANILNHINNTPVDQYDYASGDLMFDHMEYQQVAGSRPAESGEVEEDNFSNAVFKSEQYTYTGAIADGTAPANQFVRECEQNARSKFKSKFESFYDITNDTYDYSDIQTFLSSVRSTCSNPSASGFTAIQNAMDGNKEITIIMDRMDMKVQDASSLNTPFWFEAKYKVIMSGRGKEGTYEYNVIAVYTGTLKKQVKIIKKIAAEYLATANYVGIARKVWYDYDGMAYYRGAVTKGNGVGNVNPSDDNEILMFSDDQGYLRRPVWATNENGVQELKNFYRVESDYVYLTDVFKNGIACFYMHPLKKPIYDYRGPDDRGFYEGDAVKLFTASMKNIPSGYQHSLKLRPAEMQTIDKVTNDFQVVSEQVPMRYYAELYTSFISTSSDTFKVTYNAFDDNDKDNVALDNGVTEEIYNYPFMMQGYDFFLEEVDAKARVNKIRLPEPARIEDTRHYISFKYTITAENKATGKKFTTSPRTASILNRDYVVPAEYSKFDGRAMIISPESDGILQSPMDMVLYDQAASRTETIITSRDTDFIFYATIAEIDSASRGGVNIRCNPDGSGYITAETTIETGFWDERIGSYTKKLCLDSPYFIENGYIYPGFKVKCIDARHIKVLPPREDKLLESWYPRLQFGHYSQILDQYGTHTKVCYTMPEYDTQHFSTKYGKPYVDVENEQVTILNSHMVKTQCFPLLNKSVSLFKKVDDELFDIKIRDISFSDGVIITKDTISENDTIIATYSYLEESYVYRGFWRNLQDFARIDLNPNIYHTYSDLSYTPSEDKPSKNLFNKVIYFFMRPRVIYEIQSEAHDSLIFDIEDDSQIGEIIAENKDCLYHKIDDAQPDSDTDIYIGSVYIRQNTSLHSTILVDSRTRGGGVLESIKDTLRKQLEPESDFYLDIGYYDGEPYQENGVIIVRLDNSLLKEFGGRFTQGDIETKVKRWLGYGVYPIIEYVDAYSKRDMPQYSLQVEDSYTNILPETPEIYLECVLET